MLWPMLKSLRVKNLAIVEDAHISFGRGLNVITGETGAGKSILVGALGLVLGERADKELVRAGQDQCGVEAVFELSDSSDVDALLDDLGIQPCEDGRLIIRRLVKTSGSGKNLINDCTATVQALKRVGTLLVDMHGPHDHQSLLAESFQMDLLDSFGHLWKTRATYEDSYRALLELETALEALEGDEDTVAQQIDLLSYQVNEIESADLTDTDEEGLEQEHSMVANAQQILSLGESVCSALTEDEHSVFNGMAFSQNALDQLAAIFEDARAWHDEARSIAIQAQELSQAIASRVQTVEADPGRLQWLEDRMALVHTLKRKYGGSVADILTFYENAKDRLEQLEGREARIAEMSKQLEKQKRTVMEAGQALGQQRRKIAEELADCITQHLHSLGFAHGAFSVMLDTSDPRPSGTDTIEFGFAPNPGEPMRSLRLIASSGEISRVMLAAKAVLAAHDRIPVLVFDEIDANVGGEMGNAIGEKLASIGSTHQVICITHLPQTAVYGNLHFVVAKAVSDGRTRTMIDAVDQDSRVEEVARMLGGRDLTSVTLKHAREMIELRQAR